MSIANIAVTMYAVWELCGLYHFAMQFSRAMEYANDYRFFERNEQIKRRLNNVKNWRSISPITFAMDKIFRNKVCNKWEQELEETN